MIHLARGGALRNGFFVAILIGAFFSFFSPIETGGFVSSEVYFADASESGLNIVPASCPSNPHYAGECSGGGSCVSTSYTYQYSGTCSASCGGGTIAYYSLGNCGDWYTSYGTCNTQACGGGGSCTISSFTYLYSDPCSVSCGGGTQVHHTVDNCGNPYTATGACNTQACGGSCLNGLDYGTYPSCTCPAGQVQSGSWCVTPPAACPNGLDMEQYPSCSCPAGQVVSEGSCVGLCTALYFCSGNDRYYRDSRCEESFVEACPWGCSGGACLPAPAATLNITASPTLVKSGRTTTITWTATNVQAGSCTVTENNAGISDSWTGSSGTRTSSAIAQQTIYTLRCTGSNGQVYTDTAVVNIIPVFEEE